MKLQNETISPIFSKLKQQAAIIFIFLVIYLKAMNLTGQNDQATESLSRQMIILAGWPAIVH